MDKKLARLRSRHEWLQELENELDLAGCIEAAKIVELEIRMLDVEIRTLKKTNDALAEE